MKITNILRNAITGLHLSLKRFPAAVGLASAASILLIMLSHSEHILNNNAEEAVRRIIMILALGIPVSLCTKLIFERNPNFTPKPAIYFLEAAALILYYLFLLRDFKMVSVTRYIGISLALYLAFLFIPCFFKGKGFELYVIKLLARFFVTAIYSAVLFLGTAAILFTLDKLLEVNISPKAYLDVWIAVAGIFAPCFFLAGVPPHEDRFEQSSYPKLLNVLLLYIVMPIAAVYTGILYIYFAKIILLLQWPVGMVTHLVLWYSVICTAIIFLTAPLAGKNAWVRTFIFLLPKLILPLIIMMFVSVGIRVRAYGVTENRYFVILLGLWAFGIMAYLNFTRVRRNIILAVSLAIIAFLSVTGPWSSYSVSKYSQNERFESILSRYGMLRDSAIIKPEEAVSETDKEEISQILNYFLYTHKLSDVRYLPEGFNMDQMSSVFGFSGTENNSKYRDESNFSYSSETINSSVDIHGYSYLLSIRGYDSAVIKPDTGLEVRYDSKLQEITISSEDKELYKTSMADFGKQIYKRQEAGSKYGIAPEDMSLTDENEDVRIKIVFQNISGYEDNATGKVVVESMDFYMLLGRKQG